MKKTLEQLVAEARAAKENKLNTLTPINKPLFQYNTEQQKFINLVLSGQSCTLIGAAGTGKTTCVKGAILELISSGQAGTYKDSVGEPHKHLQKDSPGIVAVSFTNRAVQNLKRNLPPDLHNNCLTIHKLLEYKPFFEEIYDTTTCDYKTKRTFQPSRNSGNPLCPSIKTIIIDESSMVATDLFQNLVNAIGHKVQFIYLGDIQQLPPIFGPAILGFKMLEHISSNQLVELTHVYRQALESPIIRLAHKILSGTPIPHTEFTSLNSPGLALNFLNKPLDEDNTLLTYGSVFNSFFNAGKYNPESDIILMPFNKAVGTIELNKRIANFLARKYNRETFEINAGFNKLYLSVGDKVMLDKEDGIVTEIKCNSLYTGQAVQSSSKTLDYWGHDKEKYQSGTFIDNQSNANSVHDIDNLLSAFATNAEDDDIKSRQASHIITIKLTDSGEEETINTTGEIATLALGYAITIHKAQGSQWPRVFCLFHRTHNTMIQRELLYTAVTRAQEELVIICEQDTFVKGIAKQRIQGNTLEEKAEYFKGKQDKNIKIEEELL